MLLNRDFKRQQLPWVVLAGVILAGLAAWFVAVGAGAPEWPGGGSPVGLTLGIVGGVLILFEVFLWPRKKKRAWRIGRVRIWLAGHIWLGLITLPLLILHSGFRLGEALAATLTFLLVVVVLSGVFGLVLQQVLPRRMLEEVPAETIYSQIDDACAQAREEARRLVAATCGLIGDEPPGGGATEGSIAPPAHEERRALGAPRAVVMGPRSILAPVAPLLPIVNPAALIAFFESTLLPYLERGQRSDSPLRWPSRAAFLFGELKAKLDPTAHPVVTQLERAWDLRRQLDRQVKLHLWLHGWLLVHLPLSLALVVLMFVHVYFATRYW